MEIELNFKQYHEEKVVQLYELIRTNPGINGEQALRLIVEFLSYVEKDLALKIVDVLEHTQDKDILIKLVEQLK